MDSVLKNAPPPKGMRRFRSTLPAGRAVGPRLEARKSCSRAGIARLLWNAANTITASREIASPGSKANPSILQFDNP